MNAPPLRLDLALRPHRPPAVGRWLLLVGVVLLAASVVWVDAGARLVDAAQGELDRELEWAGRHRQAGQKKPADPRALRAERAARAMQADLALPWNHLLAALEAAQRDDVALLVVEPNAAERRVRLQLQARSVDAMLAYLEGLQADGRLADVLLQTQQRGGDNSESAVRFQVGASWGSKP